MATSHWFIGGGAEHTAEMVRRDSYAGLGGAQGVCEPADMKVLPLAVPGQGVRVTIGSVYVNSLYAGAVREAYMGSITEQEIVSITPTGSGAARRDLIVARVKDPYVAGSPWPDPGAGISDPDAADGARAAAQYFYIEVVTGVPAGTKRLQDVAGYETDTAYTLARIDLPASTGTVTQGMITDLRELHTPKIRRVLIASDLSDTRYLGSTTAFPDGYTFPGELTGGDALVGIPDWATHCRTVTSWCSVYVPASSTALGQYWLQFGSNADPDRVMTTQGAFDSDNAPNGFRETWMNASTVEIPEAFRGKTKNVYPKARLSAAVATDKRPFMNTMSSMVIDLEFFQQPI